MVHNMCTFHNLLFKLILHPRSSSPKTHSAVTDQQPSTWPHLGSTILFTAGTALVLPREILLSPPSTALELQLPLSFLHGGWGFEPRFSSSCSQVLLPGKPSAHSPAGFFEQRPHGRQPILHSDTCLLGPTLLDALWTLR